LPTEQEWERVARFTDGRKYPWGKEFSHQYSNTLEGDSFGTSAVCTYPLGKSQEGIFDLSGNIWEWSASWYQKNNKRSIRGGSWYDGAGNACCDYRGKYNPVDFLDLVGFRCVISLAISEF
jgi:formylglycine-generating enzyme required for sulfatase activity